MLKGEIIFFTGLTGFLLSLVACIFWRKKSTHKFFLSLFFGSMMSFLTLMGIVGKYADVNAPFINFASLLFFVNLLIIPPGMYLYGKYYLNEKALQQNFHKNLLYFFPAIGLLVLNLTAFVVVYSAKEDSFYTEVAEWVMSYANAVALLFVFLLQNIFYGYMSIKNYQLHKKSIADHFSYTEGIALKWIRQFIMGYFILIVLIYLQMLGLFGNQNYTLIIFVVIYGIFILYFGYTKKAYAEIVSKVEEEDTLGVYSNSNTIEAITLKEDEKKEVKIIIPKNQQEQIWQRVIQLMEEDKIFLDQQLTIHKMARLADTNSKYLRFALKQKTDRNFSQFVNKYRVAEVENLLLAEENYKYNIEVIGEMAGFKSKSAFYTTFKEILGETPQQYRNKQ